MGLVNRSKAKRPYDLPRICHPTAGRTGGLLPGTLRKVLAADRGPATQPASPILLAVEICSAIIFGNFANLLIGLWGGGVEIETNPYQNFDTGEVGLRALVDLDVAVRNPESFCVMSDALTA